MAPEQGRRDPFSPDPLISVGVSVIPTTADAIASSVAVAAQLGLPIDNPVVVAEGYDDVTALLRQRRG